jgi:hypothetical protein
VKVKRRTATTMYQNWRNQILSRPLRVNKTNYQLGSTQNARSVELVRRRPKASVFHTLPWLKELRRNWQCLGALSLTIYRGFLRIACFMIVLPSSLQTMVLTEPSQTDPTNDVPARSFGSFVLAARPGLYTLLFLAVVLSAGAYGLREYGIFSCQASGYASDGYLGYCGGTSYGDYDHGAIWFGLEPAASAAAVNAQVLFIGDSRTQFGFSSKPTADWFSSRSESYYLLGFSHFENYTFEAPLLRKLRPRAKVYIINLNSFFERSETGPGKTVMQNESARTRYEKKRRWQRIHKAICTTFTAACGHEVAIFRSRSSGAWLVTDGRFASEPVSYNEVVDQNILASYTALGNEFLPSLSADRACTILTIVPTVKTGIGTAKALAAALGLNLVAPRPPGLITFDGYHLDPQSAQRWSAAFLAEAGPQIQRCLRDKPQLHVAMSRASVANH